MIGLGAGLVIGCGPGPTLISRYFIEHRSYLTSSANRDFTTGEDCEIIAISRAEFGRVTVWEVFRTEHEPAVAEEGPGCLESSAIIQSGRFHSLYQQ